jgi:hypothetical protein
MSVIQKTIAKDSVGRFSDDVGSAALEPTYIGA